MQASEPRFAFGENWQSFRRTALDAGRVAEAVRALDGLVGRGRIEGRRVLDVGSGSGLMSLAALRLGAREIVSFDVDPESVACTRALKEAEGARAAWRVEHGSVLDRAFVDALGAFDLVYAWGVLHHTGAMWEAVANATRPVAPGGALALALYNDVRGELGTLSSTSWRAIKRAYVEGSPRRQRAMLAAFMAWVLSTKLLKGENPARLVREYRGARGMSWTHDARDWLGGFPYEFARRDEVTTFVEARGLRTARVVPVPWEGWGNNEFVFERP